MRYFPVASTSGFGFGRTFLTRVFLTTRVVRNNYARVISCQLSVEYRAFLH